MPLSKDVNRDFYTGDLEKYPVKASAQIFKGSAVGEDGNGYARALEAGDKFLGFAEEGADNSNGADGAISVLVRIRGCVSLKVDSLAITDNNRPEVYAENDDTFSLQAEGNSLIGTVRKFESAGKGLVEYDAARVVVPEA